MPDFNAPQQLAIFSFFNNKWIDLIVKLRYGKLN
jgi:hypothetical protein